MEEKLLSIGKVAKLLGVSIQTLRRWDEKGKLKSFRPAKTSKRYYRREDLEAFIKPDIVAIAERWIKNEPPDTPQNEFYCPTRDIFEGRLTKIKNDLAKINGIENLLSLIVAITGEMGNNSFDHNLGVWPDIPGIFFGYDIQRKIIALADRGQGILTTLKRVKPELKNDEDGLKTAFTEIITARAPEKRGNGLKFVKNVVTANPLNLFFQSGNAQLQLKQNDKDLKISKTPHGFRGCIAFINF